VAWAHEGLGRLHEKQGDVEAALASYEQAALVWRHVQSGEPSKQLFEKELGAVEQRRAALLARSRPAKPQPHAEPSTEPGTHAEPSTEPSTKQQTQQHAAAVPPQPQPLLEEGQAAPSAGTAAADVQVSVT